MKKNTKNIKKIIIFSLITSFFLLRNAMPINGSYILQDDHKMRQELRASIYTNLNPIEMFIKKICKNYSPKLENYLIIQLDSVQRKIRDNYTLHKNTQDNYNKNNSRWSNKRRRKEIERNRKLYSKIRRDNERYNEILLDLYSLLHRFQSDPYYSRNLMEIQREFLELQEELGLTFISSDVLEIQQSFLEMLVKYYNDDEIEEEVQTEVINEVQKVQKIFSSFVNTISRIFKRETYRLFVDLPENSLQELSDEDLQMLSEMDLTFDFRFLNSLGRQQCLSFLLNSCIENLTEEFQQIAEHDLSRQMQSIQFKEVQLQN